MAIKRSLLLFFVLMLFSLSLVQAQANNSSPAPFGNLEVITPDNLDRLVKLRDLDTANLIDKEGKLLYGVSFNANSTLLAGLIGTGVELWSLDSGYRTALVKIDFCDCWGAQFSFHPTAPDLAVTCGILWNLEIFQPIHEGSFCDPLAFDSKGLFLVTGHPLRILDATSGTLVQNLPQTIDGLALNGASTPILNVCSIAYSPDGKKLAYSADIAPTGENMLVINILDLNTGAELPYIGQGDAAWMGACDISTDSELVFSLDSQYLYSNASGTLLRFNAVKGEEPAGILPSPSNPPATLSVYGGSFALTPDNQLLLYTVPYYKGSGRYTMAVNMATEQEISIPEGFRESRISFSPDGKLLAAFDEDAISIWGVPSKEQ